jgi:hypothetical protein
MKKSVQAQQRDELLVALEQATTDMMQNQVMSRMMTHVPRGQPPTDQRIIAEGIALVAPVTASTVGINIEPPRRSAK